MDKAQLLYLGKKYPLRYRPDLKNIVEFTDAFYIASKNSQAARHYLTAWYKLQARQIIQKRLNHHSTAAGLKYNTMSITEAQTRWGSCSSQKNLRFNWRLIMAPLRVVDYVIAHELAHLTEMNHSREFWKKVFKMFPLYREYRTWLNRYGHTLII